MLDVTTLHYRKDLPAYASKATQKAVKNHNAAVDELANEAADITAEIDSLEADLPEDAPALAEALRRRQWGLLRAVIGEGGDRLRAIAEAIEADRLAEVKRLNSLLSERRDHIKTVLGEAGTHASDRAVIAVAREDKDFARAARNRDALARRSGKDGVPDEVHYDARQTIIKARRMLESDIAAVLGRLGLRRFDEQ